MCYQFCPNFDLFFVSIKEKKKEKSLLSVKKIANKIIARFLIKLCVNSCTSKFCFHLSLKYSSKSVLSCIKTMTA